MISQIPFRCRLSATAAFPCTRYESFVPKKKTKKKKKKVYNTQKLPNQKKKVKLFTYADVHTHTHTRKLHLPMPNSRLAFLPPTKLRAQRRTVSKTPIYTTMFLIYRDPII